MVIKSNGRAYEAVIGLFIIVIGYILYYLFFASWKTLEGVNLFAFFFCLIFLLLIVGHEWVSDCKEILLTDKGCTIGLGPFKRFYRWDEMQTIKNESYSGLEAYVKNYGKGVYFATKPLQKIFLRRSMVMHPLSSFRIFFAEAKVRDYRLCKGTRIDMPDCYSVEEKVFFEQMEKWGIVIEPADKEFIGLEKIRRQMNVRPASLKQNEEGTID